MSCHFVGGILLPHGNCPGEAMCKLVAELAELDAVKIRRIFRELFEGFGVLADGAGGVAIGEVVAAYGCLDHALEEAPALAALVVPELFPDVVTVEKLLGIKELDAAGEFCFVCGFLGHSCWRGTVSP